MSPRPSANNPFSASRLRPGFLEFLFGEGESLEECLERLAANHGWGQIRGPHGSGKSTLLAALLPRLRETGHRVIHITLQDQQRRLPVSRAQRLTWTADTQLVIDGYEQLPFWRRWLLERFCRRRGCGLLVTTHRDLHLPEIYVTVPTRELAHSVAARLLAGYPPLIQPEDVDRAFAAQRGDVRETLFALYDVFESRNV